MCGRCTNEWCECECHLADSLSCFEIAVCCKRIQPAIAIEKTANMQRHKLLRWIFNDAGLRASEKRSLVDLFLIRSRRAKGTLASTCVPENIAELTANIKKEIIIRKDLHETDDHQMYCVVDSAVVMDDGNALSTKRNRVRK